MSEIEEIFLKAGREQVELFQSMAAIMESDHGKNFTKLISALIDGFTNKGLFSDENDERLEMRGAVIALNTLLDQMVEFTQRNAEIGEEDVKVKDLVPHYTSTLGDDEEL